MFDDCAGSFEKQLTEVSLKSTERSKFCECSSHSEILLCSDEMRSYVSMSVALLGIRSEIGNYHVIIEYIVTYWYRLKT